MKFPQMFPCFPTLRNYPGKQKCLPTNSAALLLFHIHCFFCLQVFVLFTVQANVPDKYFLVYTLLENMKRYFGSRTAENRARSREKIWPASLKFSGKLNKF
jgi:hypothetical protein